MFGGALVGGGVDAYQQYEQNCGSFNNFNWGEFAGAAATGAAAGLFLGTGVDIVAASGSLDILDSAGVGFSDRELQVAQALSESGSRVLLRAKAGDQATSDLIVDGEYWDVYTLRTSSVNRIISEATHKGAQVQGGGVAIDLTQSALREADLPENFAERFLKVSSRVKKFRIFDFRP
jgi:hypothetical protein